MSFLHNPYSASANKNWAAFEFQVLRSEDYTFAMSARASNATSSFRPPVALLADPKSRAQALCIFPLFKIQPTLFQPPIEPEAPGIAFSAQTFNHRARAVSS